MSFRADAAAASDAATASDPSTAPGAIASAINLADPTTHPHATTPATNDSGTLSPPALPPLAAPPTPAPTLAQPAQPQPTPAAPIPPPQPTAQLAQAFVALTNASQAGEPQRLVIRLDPAELGHVQVRIERASNGPTHVVLAVERTDTLLLLLQDRPHLNQALDAAGIPPEGRTLQFSLASPGSGNPGGNPGGNPSGNPGNTPGRSDSGSASQPENSLTITARVGTSRAGIDITA